MHRNLVVKAFAQRPGIAIVAEPVISGGCNRAASAPSQLTRPGENVYFGDAFDSQ
jgi:hypothetical protein